LFLNENFQTRCHGALSDALGSGAITKKPLCPDWESVFIDW
jgi:hypothetical protein